MPALMTLLGVVFRLRDRRASRSLCLRFEAPGRGGMVTIEGGEEGVRGQPSGFIRRKVVTRSRKGSGWRSAIEWGLSNDTEHGSVAIVSTEIRLRTVLTTSQRP